jgi:hypothetical protein
VRENIALEMDYYASFLPPYYSRQLACHRALYAFVVVRDHQAHSSLETPVHY